MRLRKNLRIWATILAVCLCLFAVAGFGGKVVPMLAEKKEKAPLAAQKPVVEVKDTQKMEDNISKTNQNVSLAQRLIEGYTADVDQSVFGGTAIVGNSFVEDIKHFGLIKNADFYSSVELNVRNAKDFVSTTTAQPIYQSLSVSNSKNIVFVFGHNEMGWNITTFEDHYHKMIVDVKASRPDANLFVCSVIPVSKDISDKAVDGSTMERVNLMNVSLAKIATDNGAKFVDPTVLFAGPDGYLADGTSADGVSLEYKYCKAWVNYLAESIKKANN